MIAWLIVGVVAGAGFVMAVMSKHTYTTWNHGFFAQHMSLTKVHVFGGGLIVLAILLMFALIATYSRRAK